MHNVKFELNFYYFYFFLLSNNVLLPMSICVKLLIKYVIKQDEFLGNPISQFE